MISNKILQQIFEFVNTKRAGAAVSTMRPPFSSLFRSCLPLFRFPLFLPFGKFPLALLALEILLNSGEQAPGQGFKLSFGNTGTIDFWGSGILGTTDTSRAFRWEGVRGGHRTPPFK